LGLSKLLLAQLTMEEAFLRFPHLSEDIFNALDNKSLASCKEVSKVWYNYLHDQKFVRERRVRVIQEMIEKFQLDFNLKNCDFDKQFKNAFDTARMQTILNEARTGSFELVYIMITAELEKVCRTLKSRDSREGISLRHHIMRMTRTLPWVRLRKAYACVERAKLTKLPFHQACFSLKITTKK
jgi:hypothetical protein